MRDSPRWAFSERCSSTSAQWHVHAGGHGAVFRARRGFSAWPRAPQLPLPACSRCPARLRKRGRAARAAALLAACAEPDQAPTVHNPNTCCVRGSGSRRPCSLRLTGACKATAPRACLAHAQQSTCSLHGSLLFYVPARFGGSMRVGHAACCDILLQVHLFQRLYSGVKHGGPWHGQGCSAAAAVAAAAVGAARRTGACASLPPCMPGIPCFACLKHGGTDGCMHN